MAAITIKGTAWISGKQVVQSQTLILDNGETSENVVAIIDDIWEDLMATDHQYKWNNKKYFYWEYDVTDPDDVTGASLIKMQLECPLPKSDLFTEPYTDTYEGEWPNYWVTKFKTAYDNYQFKSTVQKKEIVIKDSQYIDFSQGGAVVNVTEERVTNTDIGDITNLLNLF